MLRRATAAALGTGLLALAATSLPAAEAATPGVGTSSGGAEVLHVAIGGGALDLRLLGESSSTTNETAPGAASERLTPLTLSSTLLPALGSLSLPVLEVASSGAEQSQATPAVDLGALAGGAGLPAVLGGTIDPASVRAVVDAATGSVASAAGGVTDLSVLGGVLRVGNVDGLLGSDADPAAATALRGLSIDRIDVLDLGAVLELLGLSALDLPLDVAADLLASLGLPLPGGALSPDALVATVEGLVADAGNVPAQVQALTAQVDALTDQVASLEAQLAPLLAQAGCNVLNLLPIPGLGLTCAQVQSTISSLQSQISTVNSQIDALEAQIAALVDQVLALLQPVFDIVDGLVDGIEAAPLVVIEDLAVGVTAQAVETVAGSSANVLASVGAVRIGNLALPGVDLLGTIDQLAAVGDQLTGAVGDVLATIDPALGGLVDIGLFERTTSVREEGGRSVAEGLLSGLRLSVTPPDLCGLLGRLGASDTLGGLLGDLGQQLPALPLPTADLLGDLGSIVTCTPTTGATVGAQLVGGVAPALTQPLTAQVLTVSGRGAFAATPTQVPTTTPGSQPVLPRTGSSDAVLVTLGILAAATAIGLRRVVRAASD
jgi:hypothetical protein